MPIDNHALARARALAGAFVGSHHTIYSLDKGTAHPAKWPFTIRVRMPSGYVNTLPVGANGEVGGSPPRWTSLHREIRDCMSHHPKQHSWEVCQITWQTADDDLYPSNEQKTTLGVFSNIDLACNEVRQAVERFHRDLVENGAYSLEVDPQDTMYFANGNMRQTVAVVVHGTCTY